MKKYSKYIKAIVFIIIVVLIITLCLITSNEKIHKKGNGIWDNIYGDTNIMFNSNVIAYDNTDSGTASTQVQAVIDEIYQAKLNGCYVGYTRGTVTSNMYSCNKATGTSSVTEFNSSNVKYDNDTSELDSEYVQDAIDELIDQLGYCRENYIKQNVTSSGYDCVDRCSSVTYQDGSTCSVECTTETGTYNQIAYSSYDNLACPGKNLSSGGSSCNGAISCDAWIVYSKSSDSRCSSRCNSNCRTVVNGSTNLISGYSCTNSSTTKPTATGLTTGNYCWCYFDGSNGTRWNFVETYSNGSTCASSCKSQTNTTKFAYMCSSYIPSTGTPNWGFYRQITNTDGGVNCWVYTK